MAREEGKPPPGHDPDPLDSIPALTTRALTNPPDQVAALKLVADSIAQQRQLAARAVLFHPGTISAYVLVLAIAGRLLYKSSGDIPLVTTTCAGITMTLLVAVRALTSGYIARAEQFSTAFLENDDGERDIIIGSRYGEAMIGCLILRIEQEGRGDGRRKRGSGSGRAGGKALIRAWTTKQKYRGAGVGTELLEEAVRLAREKLGNSAEIGFATEHANSIKVLPEMFNSGFRKGDARAAISLQAVVESAASGSKKRR